MSYAYSRSTLQTSIAYRLNDPRAGTPEARWNSTQIDGAISEAIVMAEPIGFETYYDQQYPSGIITNPAGFGVDLDTVQVVDILRVETYDATGKRSIVQPGQWALDRSAINSFLTLTHQPADGDTVRMHVRQLQNADDTALYIDRTMLTEWSLSILFERYVVYGSESSTLSDTQRAQAHRIAGDQRKMVLMQQQYPVIPPAPAPAKP